MPSRYASAGVRPASAECGRSYPACEATHDADQERLRAKEYIGWRLGRKRERLCRLCRLLYYRSGQTRQGPAAQKPLARATTRADAASQGPARRWYARTASPSARAMFPASCVAVLAVPTITVCSCAGWARCCRARPRTAPTARPALRCTTPVLRPWGPSPAAGYLPSEPLTLLLYGPNGLPSASRHHTKTRTPSNTTASACDRSFRNCSGLNISGFKRSPRDHTIGNKEVAVKSNRARTAKPNPLGGALVLGPACVGR